MQLALIVEGHGDVQAVPVLVRRLAALLAPATAIDVKHPVRVKRQRLAKAGELERAVLLARQRIDKGGVILVLIDADEDCPATLAPDLLTRAQSVATGVTVAVVLAKYEFENWLVAGAGSVGGCRGLAATLAPPERPEQVAAKSWLSQHMSAGRSYRETLDQAALADAFDVEQARRADSFDKLWRVMHALLR